MTDNDGDELKQAGEGQQESENPENSTLESTPPELTPEQSLQRDYDELNEKYLRLAADFENFRKRSVKDSELKVLKAVGGFVNDMLEVADGLLRANMADGGKHEGLVQISKLFTTILEKHGIKPFESIGKSFDPTIHEAIAYIPSEYDEGIVCDEVAKGYYMDEKVIRCAKVAVSKGKDLSPSETQ